MKTFYSLREFKKSPAARKRLVATFGVFDGVHRGHQKIIKTLIRKAGRRHLATLLVTFYPHPVNVLNRSRRVPLLSSLKHRLRLFEEMGIDYALVLRFDRGLSRMGAAQFIKMISDNIRLEEIIVGENFFFGKGRSGSSKVLRRFAQIYGYRSSIVGAVKIGGKVISSTSIRNLILKGELKKASKLLSRNVTVLGTVVPGRGRGRFLGFPTANIDPHHEAIPPSGVYAVCIRLDGRMHKGILNIGVRPTFGRKGKSPIEPTIEAHIFDFKRAIYDKDLEIMFVKKIRNEKRFGSSARLRREIERDVGRARRILR